MPDFQEYMFSGISIGRKNKKCTEVEWTNPGTFAILKLQKFHTRKAPLEGAFSISGVLHKINVKEASLRRCLFYTLKYL